MRRIHSLGKSKCIRDVAGSESEGQEGNEEQKRGMWRGMELKNTKG